MGQLEISGLHPFEADLQSTATSYGLRDPKLTYSDQEMARRLDALDDLFKVLVNEN